MLLKYDVELTHESRQYSFAIKKHNAPTLQLAADSNDVAARWIAEIREAIDRNNKVNGESMHFFSVISIDVYNF